MSSTRRRRLKIYCEHGALTANLRALQSEGRIELLHFPYDPDSQSRHLSTSVRLSSAQWRDMNLGFDAATGSWEDVAGSEHLHAIHRIVGGEHRRDILHLDCAFKSGCVCFITNDNDVLSKREPLEQLLGLRIFHPLHDAAAILAFLSQGAA